MNIPDDLKYTRTHEWVRQEGDEIVVGITDFAQHQLTTLTFVELPSENEEVTAGDELAVVESVKQAADVYAVASGTITAVNEDLESKPEAMNEDPYGTGWLYRLRPSNPADLDGLLEPDAYRALAPDAS